MPNLSVNGEVKNFTDDDFPQILTDLIAHLGLKPGALVAEVEGNIVRQDAFSVCELKDGYTVELVQFVGGG